MLVIDNSNSFSCVYYLFLLSYLDYFSLLLCQRFIKVREQSITV